MNSDDLLEESMRALRESTDGSCAYVTKTRMQILARAQGRMQRKRRVALVVMPLAAALTVSTAWGAVTGRLPIWLDAITGRVAPTPIPMAAGVPAEPSPATASTAIPPGSPLATTEPTEYASGVTPSPAAPNVVSSSRGRSPASSTPPSVPSALSAVSTREQSLYSTAHQAHFVDHDPAAALRAWDGYLAAYPDGRFALEARYNRAISLVRLGRRGEAREALAPFAEGKFAGYRRAEARELLDALVVADGGSQPE